MKARDVFYILCSILIILSGCAHQEKVQQPKKQAIPETNEYGGLQLTKVGQEIKQKNWGTLKLEQVKHVNETQSFHVPEKNFLYAEDTLIGIKSISREDYSSGEKREGLIGLVLSDPNEKVKTVSFKTDVLAVGDTHEKIVEPQTFTISL